MMASIFWDSQEIIMIGYLEQGCSMNGTYYEDELKRLRKEITRKRKGSMRFATARQCASSQIPSCDGCFS
jgi:hypothetical protein